MHREENPKLERSIVAYKLFNTLSLYNCQPNYQNNLAHPAQSSGRPFPPESVPHSCTAPSTMLGSTGFSKIPKLKWWTEVYRKLKLNQAKVHIMPIIFVFPVYQVELALQSVLFFFGEEPLT